MNTARTTSAAESGKAETEKTRSKTFPRFRVPRRKAERKDIPDVSPMPSRTLNVTEDAYELLASLKQDRESFTDVIKRLAGERSLFDIVGVLDEDQARRLEQRIEQGRERSRKRRGKQLRRG